MTTRPRLLTSEMTYNLGDDDPSPNTGGRESRIQPLTKFYPKTLPAKQLLVDRQLDIGAMFMIGIRAIGIQV